MDRWSIYLIENTENGMKYVGQSKDPYNRWKSHVRGYGGKRVRPLYDAIRLYGKERFVFSILEEDIETKEQALEREAFFIRTFDTIAPNGYNLTTSENGEGKRETAEETSRRLSKAAKAGIEKMKEDGRFEEHMAMMREAHKRKGYSAMHPNTKKALMESKGNRREIRCVETGIVYPSITAAASAVGGRASNMSTAIKKTGRYKGYSWQETR